MSSYTVPEQVLKQHRIENESGSDYDKALEHCEQLFARPLKGDGPAAIKRQHSKGRMTVWERIDYLVDETLAVLNQNWGSNHDGASLATVIARIGGRDVALYGHDFTTRAGSMDESNGLKLARLFQVAGDRKIPLIGLNDSAGAYIPAGVGGLDGYAEAFKNLRQLSGVVPSIMCMFGYNAGGGSYLPRQGSFVIQPKDAFLGLTGPAVVRSVLGEEVTADELGGPAVHAATGVVDYMAQDEAHALDCVKTLLRYIPDNNACGVAFGESADAHDRATHSIDRVLRKAIESPTGYNTPFDSRVILSDVCDFGDYFEFQPSRSQNTICAFGRLGGGVCGFVASNSAVQSGQIDVDAALKNTRFIRFCNLYNIPLIFIEDTTGFLPGTEQEHRGVVLAGRMMLDAIVDVRVPSILLLVRNGFGGAYSVFNGVNIGADVVLGYPTARVAVMGNAGAAFVYKKEFKALDEGKSEWIRRRVELLTKNNVTEDVQQLAESDYIRYRAEQELALKNRYDQAYLNADQALSLGSISAMVRPMDTRRELIKHMSFFMRHYQPSPMGGVQREHC